MPRGRPRKSGKRYPGGKLMVEPRVVRGNDRAEERKHRYGNHAVTALGRAYAADLLGEEADTRYSAGKKFSRIYSRTIDRTKYHCPLDDTPRGGGPGDHEQDMADQDWLFVAMAKLERDHLRPWLDLLLLDLYHDIDPPFLARLLNGGKHPADKAMLAKCIAALDLIAPQTRPMGILAQHY